MTNGTHYTRTASALTPHPGRTSLPGQRPVISLQQQQDHSAAVVSIRPSHRACAVATPRLYTGVVRYETRGN